MQEFRVKREVLGYDIEACVTRMQRDLHILLTGGCLPHTGSASIYEGGKMVGLIQLHSHKDGIVGNQWAEELSAELHCRVTVVCGIHYDHASSEMLQEIVAQTDAMLQEVIENLK